MQIANVILALGEDAGNTVPKYKVTPSEVAVLREIHGNEAVTEILPIGQIARPHRVERERLVREYGRNIDGVRRAPAVDHLFPGAAAPLFETFEQLDLPEEFYKATGRVGARQRWP